VAVPAPDNRLAPGGNPPAQAFIDAGLDLAASAPAELRRTARTPGHRSS